VRGGGRLSAGEGSALFGILAALDRRNHGASTDCARDQPSAEGYNRGKSSATLSRSTPMRTMLRTSDSCLVREAADVPDVCFRELDTAFVQDGIRAQKRRKLLLEVIVARRSQTRPGGASNKV
jgi:hypothetical protein